MKSNPAHKFSKNSIFSCPIIPINVKAVVRVSNISERYINIQLLPLDPTWHTFLEELFRMILKRDQQQTVQKQNQKKKLLWRKKCSHEIFKQITLFKSKYSTFLPHVFSVCYAATSAFLGLPALKGTQVSMNRSV